MAALTLAPGTEHVVLLPLGEALPVSGGFQVPYAAGYVQHAPLAPRTETLSEADLAAAIDFYFSAPASLPHESSSPVPPATGRGEAGEEDLVVTRSEEQLRTATETVVVRRLRLRKYIATEVVPVERIHLSKYMVTDNQTVAATVGHEVVEQVRDAG